jgi:hypothetical protein
MPQQTTFHIVAARPAHGAGEATTDTSDRTVNYTGTELKVKID